MSIMLPPVPDRVSGPAAQQFGDFGVGMEVYVRMTGLAGVAPLLGSIADAGEHDPFIRLGYEDVFDRVSCTPETAVSERATSKPAASPDHGPPPVRQRVLEPS